MNGYVLTEWRFPGHKLVFGMMLFACFIPFQSVIIPMAVILGLLGQIGDQLLDATGFPSVPAIRRSTWCFVMSSMASVSLRCFPKIITRRFRQNW